MTKITSTTYCDSSDCPGHVRVTDHPGKRVVLTDNPALPLALEDDDRMSEHVILVAFTVDKADTFKDAQEALAQRLRPLLEGQDPNSPITSWWIAQDERYDGSDCDSAVFVTPGNQPAASRILAAFDLTPDYNVVTHNPDHHSTFEPTLDRDELDEALRVAHEWQHA